MPSIKFWFAPGACSLAPHILLQEIGVDFKAVSMRVSEERAAFPEEFRAINPKMRVPALSLDGHVITEVPAVMTAIASLSPDRHLMGQTPLETARVYEWMNWLSGTLHGQGFGSLFRPQRFSNDPNAFDQIMAKGKETVAECFDAIEQKLTGVYSTGDALTAVDPYLFVFYRWGAAVGFDMKRKYPKYTALVVNLVQRPAVKAVLAAEDINGSV